jgi:di/tricarboxylate transporter
MSALVITLLVITAALILLIATRLRPDLVALMVMLALGITGVVDNTHVFSGFSSSAVMTILGISMISVALQQTGVANVLGKMIFKISGRSEILLIFLTALFSATLSLFMNNIAAVGVLLPAVMSLSRRSQTPPSRILIPLAFGTILGGMATLLTTSNIIVSSALKEAGFTGFGLLDYFPVGAPVVAVGLLYLVTIGRKLLPAGKKDDSTPPPMVLSEKLKNLYRLESDLLHLLVMAGSPFIGESVFSSPHVKKLKLEIIRVQRKKNRTLTPSLDTLLHEGDILIVRGSVDAQELETLRLDKIPPSKQQVELTDNVNPLAELILSPHSDLLGRNLCEIDFRAKYNLNVLGLWREGKPLLKDISTLSLKNGDALLVQGGAEAIHRLEGNQDLLLLEEDPDTIFRPQKLGLTILITLLTLGFAALDILPVALVVLSGAVLLLLTGCMNLNDAFKRIEWKAIFLIAGMWPLSLAIRDTGLAAALVNSLLNLLGNVPPLLVAAAFMLLAMLFTQFMSGPVTPIIITPLALAAASNFGIDPHPMAMAVALGCSLAFISPIAHPVNVMVMNPGGYTFKDFFKVGWPLTLLAFATILAGLHFIWGL